MTQIAMNTMTTVAPAAAIITLVTGSRTYYSMRKGCYMQSKRQSKRQLKRH